jgi:hypothetical protein
MGLPEILLMLEGIATAIGDALHPMAGDAGEAVQ